MSYYTGPIFEISMDEFGGSVGGGGRYDEMIGKFTGNNTSACGFSIGFERIVMLLLERNYEIPTKNGKKAYLIEKNMPADKMLTILKQAQEERNVGTQINISIMKKNKKFQKDQMTAEGTFASGKRPADFVSKVDVSRSIDQVQLIFLSVGIRAVLTFAVYCQRM